MPNRPARHKHDFRLDITLDTSEVDRLLQALSEFGRKDAGRVALQRVAVKSLQHALALLDALIYDTPPRGGYERTRRLRRGMKTFVREEDGGPVLYIINDARSKRGAPYPVYNELGTYANARNPADILAAAQGRVPSNLILMQFGKVGRGLEPRPFFFPTVAYAEHIIPIELERALLERLASAGVP